MNQRQVWIYVWAFSLAVTFTDACQAQDITAQIIGEYNNRLALYQRGSCSGTVQNTTNPEAEKQVLDEAAKSAGTAEASSIERQRNAIGDRRTQSIAMAPFSSAFDGVKEYDGSKIDVKNVSYNSVSVTDGRIVHSRVNYRSLKEAACPHRG